MPSFQVVDAEYLLGYVIRELTKRRAHVANIVQGPQREAWFNAELFVWANNVGPLLPSGPIVWYGEQSYRTVRKLMDPAVRKAVARTRKKTLGNRRKKAKKKAKKDGSLWMPDLVGHSMTDRAPFAVVCEQKVVVSRDGTAGQKSIKALNAQMRNALKEFGAPVLGVVYMIKSLTGGKTYLGSSPTKFYQAVEANMNMYMLGPDFVWIRSQAAPNGPPAPLTLEPTTMGGWGGSFSLDVAAMLLVPPPSSGG